MKSLQKNVFRHQHYSIEDLIACPDLPALLEWGEFRWQFFSLLLEMKSENPFLTFSGIWDRALNMIPTTKRRKLQAGPKKVPRRRSQHGAVCTRRCASSSPTSGPRASLDFKVWLSLVCQKRSNKERITYSLNLIKFFLRMTYVGKIFPLLQAQTQMFSTWSPSSRLRCPCPLPACEASTSSCRDSTSRSSMGWPRRSRTSRTTQSCSTPSSLFFKVAE